jgi:hypothetical protein
MACTLGIFYYLKLIFKVAVRICAGPSFSFAGCIFFSVHNTRVTQILSNRPLTISERTKIPQGEQILRRSISRGRNTIDEAVFIGGSNRVLDAAGMILLKN